MAANTVKFLRIVRNVTNGLKAVSCVQLPYVQVYSPLTCRHWTNGDFRIDTRRFYASEGVGVATSDKSETDEDTKKREASWKAMKFGFIAFGVSFGLLGSYAIYELGSPEIDEQGNLVEDEFTSMALPIQYLRRTWRQMNYFKKLIREPSREKLLPDPLQYPYQQPPYTLVLEMKDVLVHPDWTYKTGWRFKKRPGVDQFLEQVSFPLFELVIFTAEQGMTVFPILDALDPNGYIMYRLVRDATHFVDGHHVKNLDCLNRDLSKVIVVDWDGESVKFHKRNTLILPRWKGNDDDKTLLDLATFLRTIALAKVEDVRDVLDYYHQFDDPIEAFKENQRKLLEQMEEQKKQEEKNRNSALTKNWVSTLVQPRRL